MAEALRDLTPDNDSYPCNCFIKFNYVVVSINHLVGGLQQVRDINFFFLQLSLETEGQIESILDGVLWTKIVVFSQTVIQ